MTRSPNGRRGRLSQLAVLASQTAAVWQIASILEQLAETNDVAVGICNFKLRKSVKHPLQPARHDAAGAELCEHFTEATAFQPQINIQSYCPGLARSGGVPLANHHFCPAVFEGGKLVPVAWREKDPGKPSVPRIPRDGAGNMPSLVTVDCFCDGIVIQMRATPPPVSGTAAGNPFRLQRVHLIVPLATERTLQGGGFRAGENQCPRAAGLDRNWAIPLPRSARSSGGVLAARELHHPGEPSSCTPRQLNVVAPEIPASVLNAVLAQNPRRRGLALCKRHSPAGAGVFCGCGYKDGRSYGRWPPDFSHSQRRCVDTELRRE